MSNDNDQTNQSPSWQQAVTPSAAAPKKEGWEREVLEKLAFATIREQRARRRWGIFFKFVTLTLIAFALWTSFGPSVSDMENVGPHTALIKIDGTIEAKGAGDAESVITALTKAYTDPGSVGLILQINSPGGSPVQAGIINDEITRLRKQYPKKPLYVVVNEICASGGYYIAVAADRIYVNKASIVGSIGVLMDGFGFTGTMEKLGVERRLLTAGENKGFMDPFSPQSEKQKLYALGMLDEIHQQFIDVVRKGRGKRLKETPEIFSGLFWSGAKSVELGLADGFGTVESVAREEFKSTNIVDYTQREGLSDRVLRKFGAAAGASAVKTFALEMTPSLK
ncbi:S49 family peptidase [Herminiimonas fonticola]|uniref:Protease-4 n=1 Tax=Herminiimonas fonticola TaxID=303380 RepID=A0A4R6GIW3_9BURK|nr:S49 family peptidase [Herminiimonas fonticola]RBA25699.1 Periplasmic serine proteases (ClpP class) [Herminiimonas fonticola]TDN94807.1 protease-4 [Herminiimonas fonticola]